MVPSFNMNILIFFSLKLIQVAENDPDHGRHKLNIQSQNLDGQWLADKVETTDNQKNKHGKDTGILSFRQVHVQSNFFAMFSMAKQILIFWKDSECASTNKWKEKSLANEIKNKTIRKKEKEMTETCKEFEIH